MTITTSQQAILRRASRIIESEMRSADVTAFSSPSIVVDFLQYRIGLRPSEVFGVLFLDSRHRHLAFEEMFHGTIDSAAVYPREIVRRALEHNASALIVAHNHPSHVCEPSDTDVRLTRKLVDALALIDVRILDHVIVGGNNHTSLAERGLM